MEIKDWYIFEDASPVVGMLRCVLVARYMFCVHVLFYAGDLNLDGFLDVMVMGIIHDIFKPL